MGRPGQQGTARLERVATWEAACGPAGPRDGAMTQPGSKPPFLHPPFPLLPPPSPEHTAAEVQDEVSESPFSRNFLKEFP